MPSAGGDALEGILSFPSDAACPPPGDFYRLDDDICRGQQPVGSDQDRKEDTTLFEGKLPFS